MVHDHHHTAAIAIQAVMRGKLGRVAARRRKMRVIQRFMAEQRQHLAAAIIQSAFFRKMYPESDEDAEGSLTDDEGSYGSGGYDDKDLLDDSQLGTADDDGELSSGYSDYHR